jgi:hypothetical protein
MPRPSDSPKKDDMQNLIGRAVKDTERRESWPCGLTSCQSEDVTALNS